VKSSQQPVHMQESHSRELTPDDIRQALLGPLPGVDAHMKMVPQPRPGWNREPSLPPDCRQGAVLILLYPRSDRLYLVLTRRSDHVGSHKGQISLPGGAQESDESLVETALRETWEELGIPSQGIEVMGNLTPLYTPPSNYCIHPFVAYRAARPIFHPHDVEVAQVLEVALGSLLDPAIRRVEYWADQRFDSPRRVPCFDIDGQVVWGATAMILSEFVSLLEQRHAG
jgi:8-oxo-dGTP pyrophosphatase MutT (NUDIX family)